MMNENAISNILIDVDFLEEELKRIRRPHLATVFTELRLVSHTSLEEPAIDTDYFGIDNIHSTRWYCSGVSHTCQQACIICTCEAQTITSSSREVSSIWSESTRCSFKGIGRKETKGSRGCRTSVSWRKSLILYTLAIPPIVNYSMYNILERSIFWLHAQVFEKETRM